MLLEEHAYPLSRSWCLFELVQTFKLRGTGNFSGLQLVDSSGVLNSGNASVDVALRLGLRLKSLDLMDAKASLKSDEDMIKAQVVRDLGSFSTANALLKLEIKSVLLTMHKCVNKELEALLRELDSHGEDSTSDGLQMMDNTPEICCPEHTDVVLEVRNLSL